MKKLFNNRFLFILALSLIVLITLGIGAFYLFDDSDDFFVKSGYVLNPLSTTSEKYFFNEDTNYKVNLSSMVEFKDIDDKDVTILKDSFLHYNDKSLSFLKNGAILDLNSINGSTVTFYNITNKSIIEKNNDGYVIKNSLDDVKIKNFIGRINENKYIVVGDGKIKIPGNTSNIDGEYFEITYIEEGIVNIENNSVKYQTAADGVTIYIAGMAIDLGNKRISRNGEDIMSMTAITIDGNENIEIIPVIDKEENKDGNSSSGIGDGSGGSSGGNGTDNDKTNGGNGTTDIKDKEMATDTVVALKDASIGSTNVDVTFDILNAKDDDLFMLKVTNLDSGRTIDMVSKVTPEVEIRVNLLSPNTKYLFTVINEKDNGKYFQKIFETNDFGIKLEKAYATDDKLAYKVIVGEGTDITNAKLTLYKYNETTKKNEVVTKNYYDATKDENKTIEMVTSLSSADGSIEGVHEIAYDGLDSNTIYTAVLDEFSVVSSNFKDVYNITLTSMTLKKTPAFNKMTIDKNKDEGIFKLSIDNITDEDNAITNYTYLIYNKDDSNNLAISPISKKNASPITIKVGDGDNELRSNTNYFYKVIIEYFDNEKYVEYVTNDSINFVMGDDPFITVIPKNEGISYNKIAATIYLTDISCLVSMPGRKCAGDSTTIIDVKKKNAVTGEETSVFTKLVDFTVSDDEIKYELLLDNLEINTMYAIDVKTTLNDDESHKQVTLEHADGSTRTISTKSLSTFVNEWNDIGSNATHVINLGSKLIGEDGSGTLSSLESVKAIKKIVLKLYEGNDIENISEKTPIATKSFINSDYFNIKEKFYDNEYIITSDETFGLDIDDLKALNADNRLSEYYTIAINGYYDNGEVSSVNITNSITSYQISPLLLMENITDPVLIVGDNYITNQSSNIKFDKLNNNGTYVGYKAIIHFDRSGLVANGLLPKNIKLYVYDINGNKVKFFVEENESTLSLVDYYQDDLDESGYYEKKIYMDYGSEYSSVDDVMRRGNEYFVGYEIEADSESGSLRYPNNNEGKPSNYGIYELIKTEKETPLLKMYPSKSTGNSITYNYQLNDADHALYKEDNASNYGFYYIVNDGEEKKVNIEQVDIGNYSGTFTINNLTSGSVYKLYYKKNITKTGDLSLDVVNYFDSVDISGRLFEGYYDATLEEYNFKYEIINNPLTDNKVTFKILAAEEILNRIVSYKVNFTDSKGNVLNKEMWKLETCNGDSESDIKRCFSVDYVDLKKAGMKSDKDTNNIITTRIVAIYDNGLVGFDYTVGDDGDFKYMIMQENNTATGYGKYIVVSSDEIVQSSTSLKLWDESLNVPKGYYTYKVHGVHVDYLNVLTNKERTFTVTSVGALGKTTSVGTFNPKMLSIQDMATDNNKFSFSSITPKVSVVKKTGLLNGIVENLTLSGIDLNDVKKTDGKYYLYVDTWDNMEDAVNNSFNKVVRPRIKVEINKDNPTKAIETVIDGLENSKYYFNVYAYLHKDGDYKLTQLFSSNYDDKYQVETYEFSTLAYNDIYFDKNVSYTMDKEVYGNRILNTEFKLKAYQNSYPYNFDLKYRLCNDVDHCSDSENIIDKTISSGELKTSFADKEEIPSSVDFGRNYYMSIFAVVDIWYINDDGEWNTKKEEIFLNPYDTNAYLNSLKEPIFKISRNASYIKGDIENEYYIDFDITVDDSYRTLSNGKYYVKLLDTDGNITGRMQQRMVDGSYQDIDDYKNYEFDALTLNKRIRITDLSADTKYTIVVYNEADINNYSDTISRENRKYEVSKTHTIYTVNDYGVAFGRDLIFSATEKSIVVTFLGGSNFDNVKEITYTIGLWDNTEGTSTSSETDIIGENNKKFECNSETGDWRYVLAPDGMNNILGQTYLVGLQFKVKIPGNTPEEDTYIIVDGNDNPAFANAKVQYVKDNEKK